RISVASAGNDHRLGANEAPPAVVSIFLGDEITAVLDAIEKDEKYEGKEKEQMRVGVHILPKFPKDSTDRNRTSPFAFTGNKFEFRMLGSSASIADTNTVINTAVTQVLNEFYEKLKDAGEDFTAKLHDLIKNTVKKHKRILFNGNGYDDAWINEAKKRGLSNFASTPEAVSHYLDKKNIDLFVNNKIFSEKEIRARYDIMLENYSKVINIEALTMVDMAKKRIIPAVSKYTKELASTIKVKEELYLDTRYEKEIARKLSILNSDAFEMAEELENAVAKANTIVDLQENADAHQKDVLSIMEKLRSAVDKMEAVTAKEYWPFPNYSELLFGVK
ncbi:MAG: glutamine synthetase type III, partial [Clostridia bacterium]|nr:glutamine synthetase type III [Clostridia bacterium]